MEPGLELGKLAALGLMVTGAAYAAWPSKPAETTLLLAQPLPVALERLRVGQRVVEGTGMGSLTLAAAGSDGDALLIGITRAGDPTAATCRVTFAPASEETSTAQVDCSPQQAEDRPLRRVAAKALDLVVREHVAATVGGRAYDIEGVSTRLIALVATQPVAVAGAMRPPRD